jgi:biopolymer transport protein ExbB
MTVVWGSSLVELLHRGGGVMWPLLVLSIVALAVAVERALVFRVVTRLRLPALVEVLRSLVCSGELDQARRLVAGRRHPAAVVVAEYLEKVSLPGELRGEIVGRTASMRLAALGRRLHLLSVAGHLAPMLGLLGTVTGLVTAFWQIELKGGQVVPSDLASGIWEALLTTVFGLCIAIPALAAHHLLDQWLGRVELQIRWIVAYLDEWLATGPQQASSPPAAAGWAAQGAATAMSGALSRPAVDLPEPVAIS